MKWIEIFFGMLATLYAVAQLIWLASSFEAKLENPPSLVFQGAIICGALAIALALFKSASKRSAPPEKPEN